MKTPQQLARIIREHGRQARVTGDGKLLVLAHQRGVPTWVDIEPRMPAIYDFLADEEGR